MSARTQAQRQQIGKRLAQKPLKKKHWGRWTYANAAKRAAKRRARGKRGGWLRAMPRQSQTKGRGNAGQAPRYSDDMSGKRL